MEDKKEVALDQYEDVIKPHLNRDTLHNIYARWANSYDQVTSIDTYLITTMIFRALILIFFSNSASLCLAYIL